MNISAEVEEVLGARKMSLIPTGAVTIVSTMLTTERKRFESKREEIEV